MFVVLLLDEDCEEESRQDKLPCVFSARYALE